MDDSRSLWFAATLLMLLIVASESASTGVMTLILGDRTLGAVLASVTYLHSKAHLRNSGSSQPSSVFSALLAGTMLAGFVAVPSMAFFHSLSFPP